MDISLLLSDEEYQAKHEGQHSVPYKYEIKSNSQVLFYFGTRHSHNPQDKQWEKLTDYWKRFLNTVGGNRVLLLEGPQFDTKELSNETLIQRFGESGVLIQLAQVNNVPVAWPDISITDEASLLSKQFDQELVHYYIFIRSVGAWLRAGTMGDFDTIVAKAVEATLRRVVSAPSEVATYANIHEHIFGRPFSPNEQEVIIRASAPVYHDSIINDIARVSSRARNEHIVLEAKKCWQKGDSIFMLFGAAHAVIQEPALRTLTLQ